LKSAVAVHGTVDKADDQDTGYDVEIAIPWTAFAKNAAKAPPANGDVWRMNFYAMKANNAVSWSPQMSQGFHRAARFGRVHFGPAMPAPPPGLPFAVGSGGPNNPNGLRVPRMRARGLPPNPTATPANTNP
jgi:hypothetical protein